MPPTSARPAPAPTRDRLTPALRGVAMALEVFAAAAAIAGGIGLAVGIVAPKVFETTKLAVLPASSWRPFGYLLLLVVAVPMVAAVVVTIVRWRRAWLMTLIAGALLTLWQVAQLVFVGSTAPLQLALVALGVALVAPALVDRSRTHRAELHPVSIQPAGVPARRRTAAGRAAADNAAEVPLAPTAGEAAPRGLRPRRKATRTFDQRTEGHGLAVPPGHRSDPEITGLTERLATTGELPVTRADTGPMSAILAPPTEDDLRLADTGRIPPVRDEILHSEPMPSESVSNESVHPEPVHHEPVPTETVRSEPVRDESGPVRQVRWSAVGATSPNSDQGPQEPQPAPQSRRNRRRSTR